MLSIYLQTLFIYSRAYSADIQTEPVKLFYDYDQEELPHAFSTPFNPYRQSKYHTNNVAAQSKSEHGHKKSIVYNVWIALYFTACISNSRVIVV